MTSFFRLVILGSACWTAGLPVALAQASSEEEELAQIYGDKTTISIATGAAQPLRRAPAVAVRSSPCDAPALRTA